jgi:hypothetical protein
VWVGKTTIHEAKFQEMNNFQFEIQKTKTEQAGEPKIHSPWGLGQMT